MEADAVSAVMGIPFAPFSRSVLKRPNGLLPVVHGLGIDSVNDAPSGEAQEVRLVIHKILENVLAENRTTTVVSVRREHGHHVELEAAGLGRNDGQHSCSLIPFRNEFCLESCPVLPYPSERFWSGARCPGSI